MIDEFEDWETVLGRDIIGVAIYTVLTWVVPGTTVVTAIILKPVARGIDFDVSVPFGRACVNEVEDVVLEMTFNC